jgi:hypothetical protein
VRPVLKRVVKPIGIRPFDTFPMPQPGSTSSERSAEAFEPNYRFLKLDTDAEPGLAKRLGTEQVPHFRNGQEIAQLAGTIDRRMLEPRLQSQVVAT